MLKRRDCTAVVALVTSYGISRSVNNSNTELSDLTLANLEALADEEGCGGLAKLSDSIWHVTVEIGGNVSFPKMTCTTGGCYKCSSK
ncbi:NVEALA domain-containing protein [Capnocytophaga canis]|uniref:NVEALA domain-containing protein n=1 Tax=Capnocytophaga canis TaxID=1848903 RepID=UPI0037D48E65